MATPVPPASDQLDGDLHSVTDDEFFDHLDTARQIPIYDADGHQVDVFADVVDARAQKAAIEAAGGTWTAGQFLPGGAG